MAKDPQKTKTIQATTEKFMENLPMSSSEQKEIRDRIGARSSEVKSSEVSDQSNLGLSTITQAINEVSAFVPNISSLKSKNVFTFQSGVKLSVGGYYNYGDGGGGDFLIREPIGSEVEDNGITFELSDGRIAERILSGGDIDAIMYGARPGDNISSIISTMVSLGKPIKLGAGEYLCNVVITNKSNFALLFADGATLKCADGAETTALRISACTDFTIRASANGNKANNVGGGSGAGAGNAMIGVSTSSYFHIDARVVDAHTTGIGLDGCNNFTVGNLHSVGSRQKNVSIYECNTFHIDSITSGETELAHGVRFEKCTDFSVGSIIAKDATTINVLVELDCARFTIGSIISDGGTGAKIEQCTDWIVNKAITTNSSVHGFTVNDSSYGHVGSVISHDNTRWGIACLCQDGFTVNHVTFGDIITHSNGEHGVGVQRLGGAVGGIYVSSLDSLSNILSGLFIEGVIASGAVSIGRCNMSSNGSYGVEVTTPAEYQYRWPRLGPGPVQSINYDLKVPLVANGVSPSISNYGTDIFTTANTVPTTVTKLQGRDRPGSIRILIQDSNTTFANGSGASKIFVQGSPVAVAFGEMWEGNYINAVWYLHKIS